MINYCLALNPSLGNVLILNPDLPYTCLLLEPEELDFSLTVYTQYQNATNLNNILNGLTPLLTISKDEFLTNWFNIETCNAQGLDNWGLLLDLSRAIEVPDFTNVFGFNTDQVLVDDEYPCNFGMGNFYGGELVTDSLSDEDYRSLLKLRYGYITTNGTIASANAIMNIYVMALNPTYKAAVMETGVMQISFLFNFTLSQLQRTIFDIENILPVPACVAYQILGNQTL